MSLLSPSNTSETVIEDPHNNGRNVIHIMSSCSSLYQRQQRHHSSPLNQTVFFSHLVPQHPYCSRNYLSSHAEMRMCPVKSQSQLSHPSWRTAGYLICWTNMRHGEIELWDQKRQQGPTLLHHQRRPPSQRGALLPLMSTVASVFYPCRND